MARPPKPKRVSAAAQAAIVTGVFGLFALLLTQWKEMPWNKPAVASSAATANEKPVASVQPNPMPVAGQLPGNTTGDTFVDVDSKPAPAQPLGDWVMPARFTINQQGCGGTLEVIGTWNNGVDLSDGAAISHCGDGPAIKGRATGTLGKNHLKLTIEWDSPGNESVGVYEGAVDARGHVDGFAFSPKNPDWGRPTWHGGVELTRG